MLLIARGRAPGAAGADARVRSEPRRGRGLGAQEPGAVRAAAHRRAALDRPELAPAACRTASACALDPGPRVRHGQRIQQRAWCCSIWKDASRGGERVLDYGCGSGILAIAAAKLGAAHVDAVDIDPQAVRTTAANAHANGVAVHAMLPEALRGAPYDMVRREHPRAAADRARTAARCAHGARAAASRSPASLNRRRPRSRARMRHGSTWRVVARGSELGAGRRKAQVSLVTRCPIAAPRFACSRSSLSARGGTRALRKMRRGIRRHRRAGGRRPSTAGADGAAVTARPRARGTAASRSCRVRGSGRGAASLHGRSAAAAARPVVESYALGASGARRPGGLSLSRRDRGELSRSARAAGRGLPRCRLPGAPAAPSKAAQHRFVRAAGRPAPRRRHRAERGDPQPCAVFAGIPCA